MAMTRHQQPVGSAPMPSWAPPNQSVVVPWAIDRGSWSMAHSLSSIVAPWGEPGRRWMPRLPLLAERRQFDGEVLLVPHLGHDIGVAAIDEVHAGVGEVLEGLAIDDLVVDH